MSLICASNYEIIKVLYTYPEIYDSFEGENLENLSMSRIHMYTYIEVSARVIFYYSWCQYLVACHTNQYHTLIQY